MTIADVQRRYRELGRLRMGDRDERGFPTRLEHWRLTSPSLELLRYAAGRWGGVPQEWPGAPTEGAQYELTTETAELEVRVPPQDARGRQLLELYTKGGVQRRCDGVSELISGRPCLCDPDNRECTPTTHVLFMLPDIPDMGVWRLTSRGWNAAFELPTTVELLVRLSAEGVPPLATLAIEGRTAVRDGQTKHFNVPVLRIPYSMNELTDVLEPAAIGRPAARVKPPLDAGERPALPADAAWEDEERVGAQATGLDGVPDAEGDGAGAEGLLGEGPEAPAPSPEVTAERVQAEALRQLLAAVHGKLPRAATLVNKANKTSFTQTTVGQATAEQLVAGLALTQEASE